MPLDSLITRLRRDRVYLDPALDADRAVLRKEVEDFAEAMSRGKGREEDAPRMYCSALIDNRTGAKDVGDFKDAVVLVVSVGGTNTHYRAIEIKGGSIVERTDIWKSLGERKVHTRIATPCGDGEKHTLEEMLTPIVEGVLPWLEIFMAERKAPHILLNWGFPQRSIRVPSEIGITGAIGQRMTKGQSAVEAEGREIHTTFMRVLRDLWNMPEQGLDALRITVQNDTVMALYRYLEKHNRERHDMFALMIVGTGTNLTASQPYLFDAEARIVKDEEGYPVRLRRDEKPKRGLTSRQMWVNFETGRLSLTHTRARVDRLLPGEEDMLEDIENLGGSGTGFARILRNLILDYLEEGNRLFHCLTGTLDRIRVPLDAECVVQLAGAHAKRSASDILVPLRDSGLTDEALQSLQFLAGIVVHRSALRNAEVLSALSLFSGFGISAGEKPHALALEGSIWKTTRYTRTVLEAWNKLVASELQALGRSAVNVDLLVEDDYNAGVLGPAYLLGQFQ